MFLFRPKECLIVYILKCVISYKFYSLVEVKEYVHYCQNGLSLGRPVIGGGFEGVDNIIA